MILAQNTDIFGKINPPPGVDKFADPTTGFPRLIRLGVMSAILFAGLLMLVYMLWGALDWINAGGEKEKISKAQQKIQNAVVGLLLVFVAIVAFGLIAGNILGIVKVTPNGWIFTLPNGGP